MIWACVGMKLNQVHEQEDTSTSASQSRHHKACTAQTRVENHLESVASKHDPQERAAAILANFVVFAADRSRMVLGLHGPLARL